MRLRIRRKDPKRRGRRWRRVLALAALALVPLLLVVLQLYVEVTGTFEGSVWRIPSRVYSDALELSAGSPLDARALAERLRRSGYAATEDAPDRQGQYRLHGSRVEVYLRSFESPGVSAAPQRLVVESSGSRLSRLKSGDDGTRVARATVEPELLATLWGSRQEEREVVKLDAVPDSFVDAVLAAEDSRFFSHGGFDPRGILRAAFTNVRHGRIVQGGSTITQQTVKNLLLNQERTWWRKLREAAMAVMLDARYSKKHILEVYLNEVYLGQRGPVAICGVQAASRFYFGRDVQRLSVGEGALLAGLIRNPGGYNPFAHPERARARRDQVLEAMEQLGAITAEQAAAARAEPLELASGSGGFGSGAFAVDHVRAELAERFGALAERDGLRIYTSIDTRWQEAAEQALTSGLDRLERNSPSLRRQRAERRLEGAIVVTRPSDGAVLALVGGRDYRKSQFNRVVQAHRQPGSCFKPFVYLAGLEQAIADNETGLTVASVLDDSPLEVPVPGDLWVPANYDREFRGPVTVRQALELSLNIPTVRAAQQIGLDVVIDVARRAGIRSPLEPVPSLALGAKEVVPLELSTAYGTLARGGRRIEPWIVRTIVDESGQVLGSAQPEAEAAIDPQAVFLLDDVLRGVMTRGTAAASSALGYHGDAAGKTGTTDGPRDSWFVGFTPDVLGLVWVGFDDNTVTGLTGASGALPIWVDLMGRGGGGRAGWADAPLPEGIVREWVDPVTGGLATRNCPEIAEELFAIGTTPAEECPLHREQGLRRWLRRVFGREAWERPEGV